MFSLLHFLFRFDVYGLQPVFSPPPPPSQPGRCAASNSLNVPRASAWHNLNDVMASTIVLTIRTSKDVVSVLFYSLPVLETIGLLPFGGNLIKQVQVCQCVIKSQALTRVDVTFPPPAVVAQCKGNQFSCANGICIPANWRCDGTKDCEDSSDEIACPPRACAAHEHMCSDLSTCIEKVGTQQV